MYISSISAPNVLEVIVIGIFLAIAIKPNKLRDLLPWRKSGKEEMQPKQEPEGKPEGKKRFGKSDEPKGESKPSVKFRDRRAVKTVETALTTLKERWFIRPAFDFRLKLKRGEQEFLLAGYLQLRDPRKPKDKWIDFRLWYIEWTDLGEMIAASALIYLFLIKPLVLGWSAFPLEMLYDGESLLWVIIILNCFDKETTIYERVIFAVLGFAFSRELRSHVDFTSRNGISIYETSGIQGYFLIATGATVLFYHLVFHPTLRLLKGPSNSAVVVKTVVSAEQQPSEPRQRKPELETAKAVAVKASTNGRQPAREAEVNPTSVGELLTSANVTNGNGSNGHKGAPWQSELMPSEVFTAVSDLLNSLKIKNVDANACRGFVKRVWHLANQPDERTLENLILGFEGFLLAQEGDYPGDLEELIKSFSAHIEQQKVLA